MSKKDNFNLGANISLALAFGTLCAAVAYKAGLSGAGTGGGSTEPISDIIQAFAALAGVLVAGYGIFVADSSADKERKISTLKGKVDKWTKISKDFKDYEQEIVIYFQKEVYRSETYGGPAAIDDEIGAAQKGDEVRKRIRKAIRNKLVKQGELDTKSAKEFLNNTGDSGNTLDF